jgi:hypothetical protein
MRWTALLLFLLAASCADAQYTYYFSDTFSSINNTNWYPNGTISGGSSGLNGWGSVISKVAVLGPSTTNYEVKTTYNLSASGGVYETYLRATSNADINGSVTGTFYAVQLTPTFSGSTCTAGLVVYKSINGSPTSIHTQSGVPCNNQMTMRSVMIGTWIIIYINNYYVGAVQDTSSPITSGQPGVGVLNTPAGNGIARVDLGPWDNVAPNPVNTQTLGTSVYPTHVDMQWQPPSDNPGGTGVAYYTMKSIGTGLGSPIPRIRSSRMSQWPQAPHTPTPSTPKTSTGTPQPLRSTSPRHPPAPSTRARSASAPPARTGATAANNWICGRGT